MDGAGAVLRGLALNREPRLLPRPGMQLSPRSPADADARPEANALYRQGYEAGRAAAVRDGASDEARRGYEAGRARGLEEGLAHGLAEGREAGRQAVEREAQAAAKALAERLARLDALLSAMPAEIARRLEGAESDMVALCHAAVCRILGEKLVTRDGVAQAVRQAVRDARSGATHHASSHGLVTIHVHPRDLEALRGDEQLAAWLDQAPAAPGGTRWAADERVRIGGCIISSDDGTLDARIETQMAALRDVLLEDRDSSGAPTEQTPPGTET